ncbi:ras and Rab interactor 2 isoform X2 [Boleophthalmus pectinirostris]|nr:ras and Rab interactor 2 isoform X2 [Boleophthalmus pectinirostris]XP_055018968.1 ras and Rab interactor 2 isoform X2 [Boleophthalmus pectinirostris]
MSSAAVNRSIKQERKGSFFKLIESFAVELGTLKKEMGHRSEPKPADPLLSEPLSLDEDVGGLFLRGSPCSGLCSGGNSPLRAGLSGFSGPRDSGYSGSLHRKITVLDRLIRTHSVWLQLGLNQQGALRILKNQPPGTFLVRRSSSQQRKVLCVRMDSDSDPVQDFAVKESQYSFSLEGSGLSFADLFRLVAFCCISRDVLPFTLKLPEPIVSAQTVADLHQISKQGPGFWDAQSVCKRKSSSFSAPDRPPPPTNRTSSTFSTISTISSPLIYPKIKTRTPSELECCQSNGALCFINPLFIKVHQEGGVLSGKSENKNDNSRQEPLESDSDATVEESRVIPSEVDKNTQDNANSQRSPPPPRPPPPRFANSRSGQVTRTRSMPEKVPWIAVPKEKSEDRKSLLYKLGSSLTISPSTSPPKRIFSISSPITIPKPSLPLSLGSLSSSPRRSFKMSPSSSSQEEAQCDLAMEDHVIQQALRRARLQRGVTCKEEEEDSGVQDGGKESGSTEDEKNAREGGQRLSDMSLSTDSSDSLDFPQSIFLLHDPNPPTLEEINTHLPLSLPPYSSMEEDDDDDDEDYEEDFGVSLESDQEQDHDLTMVPPGHRTKRKTSASAEVIQKALKGKLRKMSGMFNSLLTPEKRAIRKVLELSRDKTTYFGGLVQDFLGYITDQGQEQGLGLDSGSELLQTVRQFLTQMKSYLRQSSELEPPIESLIPEDQIDRVLEKAMHKCVLKPLKSVIADALQESMVRSGAWTELKENMSLAKTKPPAEMGVSDALPPDAVAIEKIRQKFQAMCKLYSPEKKVGRLLQVCKLIYTIMEDNSGRLFGADDFLPMLTFVLAQCDMPQLDNEILYMMELLDPTLLNGEGGYYLTSAYGAMSLIKNFQEEQAARVLSSQTRDTLHQWHRRRTMQRTAPSIDDFQNYLRVALQELDSGCTAKTLSVRPQATVEEVCSLCAVKFSVSDPQKYGLFLVTEGSSQQLAPDTHPQKIKAELHSRDQPDTFHFVYRRMDFNATSRRANEANEANDANANPTTTTPDQQKNLSPRLSLSLPQGSIHSVSI